MIEKVVQGFVCFLIYYYCIGYVYYKKWCNYFV